MNEYERLIEMHDMCEMTAQIYAESNDTAMTVFYMNAAYGYKLKAEKLLVTNI